MLTFGVVFLYFFKLSAGKGFCQLNMYKTRGLSLGNGFRSSVVRTLHWIHMVGFRFPDWGSRVAFCATGPGSSQKFMNISGYWIFNLRLGFRNIFQGSELTDPFPISFGLNYIESQSKIVSFVNAYTQSPTWNLEFQEQKTVYFQKVR